MPLPLREAMLPVLANKIQTDMPRASILVKIKTESCGKGLCTDPFLSAWNGNRRPGEAAASLQTWALS